VPGKRLDQSKQAPMVWGAIVLSSCPICNRPLEPDFTDRPVFAMRGDGLLGDLKAYSCGPKGHVIVVAESGNGWSRLPEAQPGTNGSSERLILNSWKEIAAYVGRGVRTVQRWESDLGLPVHRPRGRHRSAVVAFAEELSAWMKNTPVMRVAAEETSGPAQLSYPPAQARRLRAAFGSPWTKRGVEAFCQLTAPIMVVIPTSGQAPSYAVSEYYVLPNTVNVREPTISWHHLPAG